MNIGPPPQRRAETRPPPPLWLAVLVCASLAAVFAAIKTLVYPDQVAPLAYALPLLLTLWHRDLRLHWGMAGLFCSLVGLKWVLTPAAHPSGPDHSVVFAIMQVANVLVAAGALHIAVRLMRRLESTVALLEQANAELEASNEELAAREEEISQQNEELQSQAEELGQQTVEMSAQTEELQQLNAQLAARERTLGDLLETSTGAGAADAARMLAQLGLTIERVLGRRALAAAVLEARGDEMIVHPLRGLPQAPQRLRRERTFGDLVLSRDRVGFLADISLRPDLDTPAMAAGGRVCSVIAAPLHLGDASIGVLEVYSDSTGEWDETQMRLTQWLAEQCGRLWATARLREQLDEQRRLMQTVTENSTVALFMIDEQARCTFANPAALELTGYTLKELAAVPLHRLLRRGPQGGPPEPFSAATPCEGAGRPPTMPDQFIRKDGTAVPVLLCISRVAAAAGGNGDGRGDGHGGLVIEVRDATELQRSEQQREQLLESERSARGEAERANRAKDEFVATLSHELRTPLNAVLGWAALLRRNAQQPAEVLKCVEIIERNARHQGQLISDLLDVSRIMAGKIRLDVQAVDVPLVVETALEAVRLAAEARGVRIERIVEVVDREVMGDAGRLQQVLWNLLSNAIKFTPPGGRVQVVVARVASYVQITVSDSGAGIAPELLPHIFERYRQGADPSAQRPGGLGLGLAIARHLVELHGGTIHARSAGPGQGSAFSVLLPVRAAEPDEAVAGPHPHSHSVLALADDGPDFDGLALLVVDDEPDARELVARILRERGAKVQTAADAEEALELLELGRPDLLISDVGMPRADGYELIRTIRQRWPDSRQAMPAIALTAFARSEDRTRALLAGFQSHIAKPVEAAELVATVASLRPAVNRDS